MSWTDFFIILVCCVLTILVCRVVPLFVLKGRKLSPRTEKALGFIPPAAFAALVANDLFNPGALSSAVSTGDPTAFLPLLAAIPVFVVARLTKSLIWSAVIGVAAFALLTILV